MPKETQKPQITRTDRGLCANCGQPAEPNLAAHYKKVHQKECIITYQGERVTVRRDENAVWHCLECEATFVGYPRGLQDHVRNMHDPKKQTAKGSVKTDGGRPRRPVSDSPKDQLSYPESPKDRLSYPESMSPSDVKPEPTSDEDASRAPPPTPPRRTEPLPPYSRHALPTPSESASPGPSVDPSFRQHMVPPLPPALDAFFRSLRMPLQHIADVFIENGFETEESLDLLCETPPEDGWVHMKDEIQARVRLAGWLAVQSGLKKRAQQLAARS